MRVLCEAVGILFLFSTVYSTAFLCTNKELLDKQQCRGPPCPGINQRICIGLNRNNDDADNTIPEASDNNEDAEMIRPISGGPEKIFEMARRMLVWDNNNDMEDNSNNNSNNNNNNNINNNNQNNNNKNSNKNKNNNEKNDKNRSNNDNNNSNNNNIMQVLPRWRPEGVFGTISDSNPDFRTKSPAMNQRGYAKSIWRNARKRNKPALWIHALRTYDRMMMFSQNGTAATTGDNEMACNIHYEGALVACAKLGYWEKALQIYQYVEELEAQSTTVFIGRNRKQSIQVTDNMVFSVIKACVVGSARQKQKAEQPQDTNDKMNNNTTKNGHLLQLQQQQHRRRKPLDKLVALVVEPMETKHPDLPLVAQHVNPIAKAYQNIGLLEEASSLLHTHLTDRTRGPEEEDGSDQLNINDIYAKDKGSYSLLVTNSILTGNWSDAVDSLCNMTEAGLYAENKHLNMWTEVSERKSKQRATRSWKKKRDEYWLDSMR